MNTFTRVVWGLSLTCFIALVILLSLALANTSSDNVLKEYSLAIGLGVILFGRINLNLYKHYRKNKSTQ